MIELDKQPFRGARSALETLGAPGSGPDRLARDELLRLVASVGDYSELAAGPTRPFEALRATSPAVVARFSAVYLVSPSGFYLHSLRNNSATVVTVTTSATPVALAGGPGTISRGFNVDPFPALSVTAGDLAALPPGLYVQLNANFPYDNTGEPIWIPQGITVRCVGDTVNLGIDLNLIVSGLPVGA